jgi:menaquinone-dependent protoporphyrinogen oxidase
MNVLVAYASKYGSTRGIAERIAQRLREAGQQADARPVQAIEELFGYDAFVLGSAVFVGHSTWLFSSGPIGTMAAKHEPVAPKEIGELVRAIGPREHRVFFGAWDRANADRGKLRFAERMVAKWLPEGDFRDWAAIEGWADTIARSLQPQGTAPR